MLNVDERLKELYRADSTDKQLILDFYHKGEEEPYLHLSSSNIKAETMELDEALSSNENLEFGSCEASQLKITLLNVTEVVKEARMKVYQILEGIWPEAGLFPGDDIYPNGYRMPLGVYQNRNSRYNSACDQVCNDQSKPSRLWQDLCDQRGGYRLIGGYNGQTCFWPCRRL